jgi:hypothetical protein
MAHVASYRHAQCGWMLLTYCYRLLPSKPQHRALESILEAQRQLYNAALEERMGAFRNAGLTRTYVDQCKALTEWRRSDPEAREVPLCLQRWTLKQLDEAYRGFFRRMHSGSTPPCVLAPARHPCGRDRSGHLHLCRLLRRRVHSNPESGTAGGKAAAEGKPRARTQGAGLTRPTQGARGARPVPCEGRQVAPRPSAPGHCAPRARLRRDRRGKVECEGPGARRPGQGCPRCFVGEVHLDAPVQSRICWCPPGRGESV